LSNPTVFRNLDSARGPQGSFSLNTTAYANGLHVIAWSVTDSAGRIEGIGSRFFQVANGGTVPPPAWSAPGPDLGAQVEDLGALARVTSLAGRRIGWALDAPLAPAPPDAGVVRVVAGARQRVELGLPNTSSGSEWQGYSIRHGRLEALPVGASLESTGRFAWQTVPGHLGDYDLLFVRSKPGGERDVLPVRVTIEPR
jgi:hypothetical protein